MPNLHIDNIEHLKWLLLVVGCGLVFVYGFTMKQRTLRLFASAKLLGHLMPNASPARQYLKASLMLAAMVSIVIAMIGPRWGTYWADLQQRQLDLIVCLDVSKSMLAEDAGMSRLDRAKDDIKLLTDHLGGGMIGLVTFAGRAQLACPLTDDYDFFRLALDDVGIHSAPKGGTDLGRAIEAADKAFGSGGRRQRAILLLTDGEDHGDTAVEQAKLAHGRGAVIYAIGIGDNDQGGLIPLNEDGKRTYLMHEGQQLWSKMDPAKLGEIARAGGGEYHPSGQVTPTQRTLEWVYSEKLAPMEKRSMEQRQEKRHYARFHWFAAVALVLLMLETLVAERRRSEPRQ